MKEKYVEERFPQWIALGLYRDSDPADVNITDANSSFDCRVSANVVNELIDRHNNVLLFLARMADAFDKANPEKFKEFWYK